MEKNGITRISTSLARPTKITEQDLTDAMKELEQVREEKYPKHKKGIFERIMNRFGWYKKQAVIVIDENFTRIYSTLMPSELKDNK